jgi:ABC-type dipeptide/oligopeptide/nickel transport system permease component
MRRSIWPPVAFLGLFAILLAIVSHWYLIPALSAFADANPDQRRLLSVHALLLMSVLLVLLALFLILIFRLGRSWFTSSGRPKPTQYVDAWAEAGKRLKPPK